jgi:hypothetical protein
VSPDEPLMAAGLDSLGAVELRGLLQDALGAPLPQTLIFDAPSPAALAAEIRARLLAGAPAAPGPAAAAARGPRAAPRAGAAGAVPPGGATVVCVASAASRCAAGAAAPEAAAPFAAAPPGARDPVGLVPLERWDVDWPSSAALSARRARRAWAAPRRSAWPRSQAMSARRPLFPRPIDICTWSSGRVGR